MTSQDVCLDSSASKGCATECAALVARFTGAGVTARLAVETGWVAWCTVRVAFRTGFGMLLRIAFTVASRDAWQALRQRSIVRSYVSRVNRRLLVTARSGINADNAEMATMEKPAARR